MVISKWVFVTSLLLAGVAGELCGLATAWLCDWMAKKDEEAGRTFVEEGETEE